MTPNRFRVRDEIDITLGLAQNIGTDREARKERARTTGSSLGSEEYVLATGTAAVRRLFVLHNIYSDAGRRILSKAGLRPGMRIADFGCGVGLVTRMLAGMTGPGGEVVGIDVHAAQLEQAARVCESGGFRNVSFLHADACSTGLERESFDLVYCRFLLLHLREPEACLREMRDVLKPGGMLVVEDGDLASAESLPPTALNLFADLFTRLGPKRGLDYTLGRRLFHMVKAAGFSEPEIEIHQPALTRGDNRFFLKWSVEEAAPALVGAGLISREELAWKLADMQAAAEDPNVLVLAPRMSVVWARKGR
jgi:SAM-dependent methyltransferase